jgi:hypothetical protein
MNGPDPTNLVEQLKYLEAEAGKGRFSGKSSALLVMHYLTFNSWRNTTNQEGAPLGAVLRGKSGMDKVCSGTGLSRSTVKRDLSWLESNGWISKRTLVVPGKGHMPNRIRVLFSQTDVEAREEQYEREAWVRIVIEEKV